MSALAPLRIGMALLAGALLVSSCSQECTSGDGSGACDTGTSCASGAGGGSAGGGTASGGGAGAGPATRDAGPPDAGPPDAGPEALRVFVTSFPLQGAMGGIAGADAFCTLAARAANKGGTWQAFLTVDDLAAPTRIAGFGPWVLERAGAGAQRAFDDRANLSTRPLVPLAVDEQGRTVAPNTSYFTATTADGLAWRETCRNWTELSFELVLTGAATATDGMWLDDRPLRVTMCSDLSSLLCFEVSKAPAPPPAQPRKRLFVSRQRTTALFAGLEGADVFCMNAARQAGKSGTWKALLATAGHSAAERMTDAGSWWLERADGGQTLAFNNQENLRTTPLAPLDCDEFGEPFVDPVSFFTATLPGGLPGRLGATCGDWTDAGVVIVGNSSATDFRWSYDDIPSCASLSHVLCLEQ